jgi:hypothetical protein
VTGVAPGTICDQTFPSVPEAVAAASGDSTADTVLVGPGTFPSGPLALVGVGDALQGSGPGTVLAMSGPAAGSTFLSLDMTSVSNLTLQMPATATAGDIGIDALAATVDGVSLSGAGTSGSIGLRVQGSVVTDTSVQLPPDGGSTAVASRGGNTVADVDVRGDVGYALTSAGADSVSRATVHTAGTGVSADSGTLNLDDTVIDLGDSSGTGLDAANHDNAAVTTTINADHVTVVGGAAGSQGAHAFVGGTASQQATVNLDNSIVWGPDTGLVADASSSSGSGAQSHATVNARYSDWFDGTSSTGGTGAAVVNPVLGNYQADPGFAGAHDYHLTATSVVVDLGDPAAGGPAYDRDGHARVTDGDGDGSAVRDMGAYELAGVPHADPGQVTIPDTDTTAPQTTITSEPHKRLTRRKARFGFASSESAGTFSCKVDRRAWTRCSSPATFRVRIGRHHFWVRATDPAGNTDPTPAAYRFRRVR